MAEGMTALNVWRENVCHDRFLCQPIIFPLWKQQKDKKPLQISGIYQRGKNHVLFFEAKKCTSLR